ncbi:hypothetical protein D3C86_1998570 [compost metagenome]
MHAAAHAAQQGHAAGHAFGGYMHHALGFLGLQAIEFAGIAVGHQHVHAGVDGTVDHGLQRGAADRVLGIKRCDQNP